MADKDGMKNEDQELPPDIKDWSKHQVKQWILQLEGVEDTVADSLFQQDINGQALCLLNKTDLKDLDVTFGPAKLIIHARDELLKPKEQSESSANQPGRPCKPYPFNRYHDTYRYIESNVFDITESGATDLIEPCHEYKAFINTTEETQMSKFTSEVIRFAAACMNCRTNGTIHFGIGDRPLFTHGQVLGVVVKDKEAFTVELKSAINDHFDYKYKEAAQTCIKPPRFIEVLSKDKTSSEKYVIEVDIVPDSIICEQNYYFTRSEDNKKAKKKAKDVDTDKSQTQPSKKFFVRDGGSSRDLLAQTKSAKPKSWDEFHEFVENVPHLSECRKQAEEGRVDKIKYSYQGSRLSQMITGGSGSLDKSHFERYVIVTNKSHAIHLDSIEFLVALNPTAVLDFDPESTEKGLQFCFDKQCTTNVHLPSEYKIIDGVEDTVVKLKLTRNTSWVVCNGGARGEKPSDTEHWLMEKGASVRDVISFLCRKDVLPHKRFLVVFLLLSRVSDKLDPIVETFSTFWQELRGQEQILCICENEDVFTCWKDALESRCGINISDRCIYELRFSEVNGTILSLVSKNRRSRRLLTCGGGIKVILEKKVESSLNTLDVLCMNQCEGGNEDKLSIEENFYRGEEASWWNFYFSEQPGSTPFIKRDKFDFIINTAIPDLCTLTKACVLLNLMHVPGCGGTTLAMHTLWTLKDKFRCAVLKDSKADGVEVAAQVVKLRLYSPKEQSAQEQLPQVPVLLMIDDFDDMDKVFELQQLIEEECVTKNIPSKSAQIIVLNCMRSESPGQTERRDTVFIGNNLSEEEQKQFVQKLKEIEKIYKNTDTFYGFMIMKENFKTEYIEGVVRNTLKNFDISQTHAKLLAILALLNVYCERASLSVSLCEEFLGLQTKPVCGTVRIEDGFGKFSTLISNIEVEGMVVFKAVKMLHSKIALHCLLELSSTHKVSKADITNLLLTENQLYESTQGKDMLMQYIHSILVKRRHSLVEESQFSPLIQEIASDTPGCEELVLSNASKRFEKDAIIFQLLARYYYLKKKNFIEAKKWARTAKDLSRDSSYIADTLAQVFKHELKYAIVNDKEVPITPENLKTFLKMGQTAIDEFKETQSLAKKESAKRVKTKRDNSPFNTSGCLGEIQVGLLITEVLEKTPVFSKDQVRHDIMGEVLSGKLKIQDVEQNDQRRNKHTHYYRILREFEDLLSTLKNGMKKNFDFLEKFSVNLGSGFGMADIREQIAQNELFKCFAQYATRFCKTESKELLTNRNAQPMLQVHQAKLFLEKQKADTFSGILNCLSKDISKEIMEKIAKLYKLILDSRWHNVTDMINVIYVNVVLSHIKLGSQQLLPYHSLLQYLCHVLKNPISQSDSLSLHFIAVLLLWPQQHFNNSDCSSLGTYISDMRNLYHAEMMDVYNGKWPVVHFFLGKKSGYERLVHLRDIKGCVKAEHEEFSCILENGNIWRDVKVVELLERVTGEVNQKLILVDTSIPNLKVEVIPMVKSQLSGCQNKSKVSCFIGFSMKGPLALDITQEEYPCSTYSD